VYFAQTNRAIIDAALIAVAVKPLLVQISVVSFLKERRLFQGQWFHQFFLFQHLQAII
jgi:hypothetical protein